MSARFFFRALLRLTVPLAACPVPQSVPVSRLQAVPWKYVVRSMGVVPRRVNLSTLFTESPADRPYTRKRDWTVASELIRNLGATLDSSRVGTDEVENATIDELVSLATEVSFMKPSQ